MSLRSNDNVNGKRVRASDETGAPQEPDARKKLCFDVPPEPAAEVATRMAGPSPWTALRFGLAQTKEHAVQLMEEYHLKVTMDTFLNMVLMGQELQDTSGGVYETNVTENAHGGCAPEPGGTHYIFTHRHYMERVNTLLPLFDGVLKKDIRSTKHFVLVAKPT